MIDTFRLQPHTELEVLLLEHDRPHGISFDRMMALYKTLCVSGEKGTLCQMQKKFYMDAFYAGNVRVRYINGKNKPQYIRKLPLARVELCCRQRPGNILRFNIKDEKPIRTMDLTASTPLFVRLSEVWEFSLNEMYMYTLKKTVSGETKEAATKTSPTFEVEIELLRNKKNMTKENGLLAVEFISLAVDLLGRYSKTGLEDFLDVSMLTTNGPSMKKSATTSKRKRSVKKK